MTKITKNLLGLGWEAGFWGFGGFGYWAPRA